METDNFTRKMEAVILFVVMAFILVLCFFRIKDLEAELQAEKEIIVIVSESEQTFNLPEGYHFECDGKDLILTKD